MYKLIIRPVLFLFDPEKVHHFTFLLIKFLCKIPFVTYILRKIYIVKDKRLERNIFGISFKNPVGLAAGFDKNGVLYNELSNFGFGFIEIGTITPEAQAGNEKKRLFRLQKDKGIINRMGFNNIGVEAVVNNLNKSRKKLIIGGNIGKNTLTHPKNYTDDYCKVFKTLHPFIDYFVLNVSCPNVDSHAKLTDKKYLTELISSCQKTKEQKDNKKPILLKISPDLNFNQLDEIIELVKETNIDGVIASNTSVNRESLSASKQRLEAIGKGGLSGLPIKNKSTEVIKYLSDNSNKSFPIIGVGGINSESDALEKLEAGADLIQIYTGFVYQGPSLIKRINKAVLKKTS